MKYRENITEIRTCVTVARNGSCRCGNSKCMVYVDGTVEYIGLEAWQKSERRDFRYLGELDRNERSVLTISDYYAAMEENFKEAAEYAAHKAENYKELLDLELERRAAK